MAPVLLASASYTPKFKEIHDLCQAPAIGVAGSRLVPLGPKPLAILSADNPRPLRRR